MFVKKVVFLIMLLLCLNPISVFAQRGCCSSHGGVVGCSGGRQLCEDGSLSPTCKCSGGSTGSSSSSSSSPSSSTYQSKSSQKAPVNYVYGCTNSNSINYNPKANKDDGSCIAVVNGCMDKEAYNYNEKANKDDGSCVAKKYGCIDKEAVNFDFSANMEDDSCQYKKEITKTKSIKFDTIYKDNEELVQGNENIIKEGKPGKKKITYDAIVDKNGKVISKKVINEEVTEKPVDEIIERGTGEASSIPTLLWIISLVGTIIYSKKNKDVKLLWNRISNIKQPIKIILYIAYIMFIIPAFIDIIIVIIDLFKKVIKKDK